METLPADSMTPPPLGSQSHLTLFVKDTGLGGAEISLLRLVSFLRSHDWRTLLIAHRAGHLYGSFRNVTDGQLNVRFPYPRQPASWPRLINFYRRVRTQLCPDGASILLSGDFYTLWAALFFRSPHTPVWSLWQGEYRFDDDFCVRRWLQHGAKRADRLLASEPVARHANSTGLLSRSVEVLNPVADDVRFDPAKYARAALRRRLGWAEGQHVALCVGRIGEGKGQAWLAEQFLRADFPRSAKLVLVGPGTDPALQSVLREAPQRIETLGARDDVPELLAAADIAIQPGVLEESFGLAALEAVLMRKPLLALKVGALPFTLGEEYPGLFRRERRSDLVAKWISLARGECMAPFSLSRDRVVSRFGTGAWKRRVGEVFGLAAGATPEADSARRQSADEAG